MADFDCCGGIAAVSSQFNLVHTYEYHHTKGEPLMKAATVTTRFKQ